MREVEQVMLREKSEKWGKREAVEEIGVWYLKKRKKEINSRN